jgi:gamma-glutamylcyclotransferase (GGCT)/AIG2-like uncharacterized protein YtfP
MTEEQYLPFFVYGTLMTGFGNHNRIAKGKTTYIREASTIGTLYSVGGFPGLIKAGEDDIQGQLLFIDPKLYDSTLKEMDRLEGYHKGMEKESLYLRRVVDVMDDDTGSVLKAWVYYFNKPVDRLLHLPHGSWREHAKGDFY